MRLISKAAAQPNPLPLPEGCGNDDDDALLRVVHAHGCPLLCIASRPHPAKACSTCRTRSAQYTCRLFEAAATKLKHAPSPGLQQRRALCAAHVQAITAAVQARPAGSHGVSEADPPPSLQQQPHAATPCYPSPVAHTLPRPSAAAAMRVAGPWCAR